MTIIKKIFYSITATIFVIFILPGFITLIFGVNDGNNLVTNTREMINSKNTVKIYNESTKDINDIEFEDYIKGVVAAEMPASFNEEALKAQAVAARTYAYKRVVDFGYTSKDVFNQGETKIGQEFLSKEQLREKWGEDFDIYYNKIAKAVESTANEIIIYGDEPIEAVFHSTSSGITENAEDVWSVSYPYLVSVDSHYDEQSPEYTSSKTISCDEAVKIINENFSGNPISVNDLSGIKINGRTEGGYVKNIQIGSKSLTGREVREALGLKSSNFSVKMEGNNLVFTTRGYGHGAGMSQYGANYLANEGYDYKEIIRTYYSGVTIIKENIAIS